MGDLDNSSSPLLTVSTASGEASLSSSAHETMTLPEPPPKKKRNLPGMPDPEAEVIALSPTTLLATNRFVCEICNKGFQRDQNLQLHRRGHNLPWKLRQRNIVTRVQSHHLACTDRPIHPLYLPTWMLYHQSCSINSLAVSHLSVSLNIELSQPSPVANLRTSTSGDGRTAPPAPPLHQAINSHHSLHFPLVHLSLLSHNQSNPTRWWASFSSAAEEPAGFIATELQIQVWKGWVHVQNKERKGLKAEAAKVRAQQREVAEQEFRQTLLKERAEKLENWKMKEKMREEKKKEKNELLRRQSSLWINEPELEKKILEAIVDTTPL